MAFMARTREVTQSVGKGSVALSSELGTNNYLNMWEGFLRLHGMSLMALTDHPGNRCEAERHAHSVAMAPPKARAAKALACKVSAPRLAKRRSAKPVSNVVIPPPLPMLLLSLSRRRPPPRRGTWCCRRRRPALSGAW